MVPKIQPSDSWDWNENLAEVWTGLVCEYSKRNLTYGSDKLPALSGLAVKISQFVDDEYYAGIWKNRLWSDLLWRVAPSTEWLAIGMNYKEDWEPYRHEIQPYDPDPAHDPKFIELDNWRREVTPDCSSLPEPPIIRYVRFGDEITYVPRLPEQYRAPSWSFASLDALINYIKPDPHVVARCESISVQHKGTNHFGQVIGGRLVLQV
jgi:hypothetical protein